MNKTFIVELDRDGDDVILPLPEELLEGLGWKEGDEIYFKDLGDGSFSMTKIEDESVSK